MPSRETRGDDLPVEEMFPRYPRIGRFGGDIFCVGMVLAPQGKSPRSFNYDNRIIFRSPIFIHPLGRKSVFDMGASLRGDEL